MSCPWSRWKQQYFFLGLLFGSPFSLPGHAKARSSLIYIKTWSSGPLSGVKLVIRHGGGLNLHSSLLWLVLATFLPFSRRESSCFSHFFGLPPLVIMASYRSYTSWLSITYQPWSSSRSCKLRIRTFEIRVRWWRPWPGPYSQLC